MYKCVLLLDESHFTSHCYSDKKILAIDIFTCGSTDINNIIEYFNIELKKLFPDIECTYLKNHKRFNI